MKTMLLVLLKQRKDTSREIGQSTSHQNSSPLMIYKRLVTSMSNRFVQVIIWPIYLRRLFRLQCLKSLYEASEFVGLKISTKVQFILFPLDYFLGFLFK